MRADNDFYGVIGYSDVMIGALYDRAIPHLIDEDALGATLCGRRWEMKLPRVERVERSGREIRWTKPVCRRCAARETTSAGQRGA